MTGPASEQNPVFGQVVSNGREDYTGLPEEDTNSTGVSDATYMGLSQYFFCTVRTKATNSETV